MPDKTDVAAALCCLVFIGILAVAAYWDRTIRNLHVFESLPYLLTAALAGFLTTFVRNGFERLDLRNKSWRDVVPFAAAIVSVPVFFVVLFAAFAPQYLSMFKGVLHR